MLRKSFAVALIVTGAYAAPAMAQSKVCVSNAGGYVMSFQLDVSFAGKTVAYDSTGNYPIGKSKCIDVTALPDGTEMWPHMDAVLGNSKNCSPKIKRDASDQGSAAYTASGTTLNITCKIPE